MTKNIKAELAGIIMIAALSLVTQLRVRKLVQDHRAKTAAQQLENREVQDREELAQGRKVESKFQKERVKWEAAYGDKSMPNSSFRSSITNPQGSSSVQDLEAHRNDSLEMVNMVKGGVRRSTNFETAVGTTITVSVLDEDDEIQHIDADGHPISPKRSEHGNGSAAVGQASSNAPAKVPSNATQPGIVRKTSLRPSAPPPPPTVVPLPFVLPTGDDKKDDVEDIASVSAEPETNDETNAARRPTSKRISDLVVMRKRISHNGGESQEALVKRTDDELDRASSVAATLDEDHDNVSLNGLSPPQSPTRTKGQDVAATTNVKDFAPSPSNVRQSLTLNTDSRTDGFLKQTLSSLDNRTPADKRLSNNLETLEAEQAKVETPTEVQDAQPEHAESHVGSLPDGLMPQRLSKVAVSYRTNEWAKHLEAAEKPELEDLPTPLSPPVIMEVDSEEPTALVSDEIASPLIGNQRNSRRLSGQNRPSTHSGLPYERAAPNFSRESLVEQRSYNKSPSGVPAAKLSRPNSANRLSALSPLPSNTLLSRRESMIKSRISSQSLTPNSSSANLLADQSEQENMTLAQRRQLLQSQPSSTTLQRQTSTTSLQKAPPSASQKWQKKGWMTKGAPPGFDSHQPKRTSSSQSDQKREALYAEWREGIREVPRPESSGYAAVQQREALMSERRQKELEKQQWEMMQQQRASQMESMMRSGQMQDAHREAMRKLQANANKRI